MKVVVIGAGIVGASAAYELVKSGVDITVIDQEQDGKATSAGAGIVSPWTSQRTNDVWYSMAKEGARYYPSLISSLSEDGERNVGYKKVGSLCVHEDDKVLDEIENRIRKRREEAPEAGDILRLTSEEARKLFPPLNEKFKAVYVTGAARVDGRLLQGALKRASIKRGAEWIDGKAELQYENGRVTGVEVEGKSILADQIIIAAGAWTPNLLKPLGIDVQVKPQRGQIAHIKLPETDTSNWPVVSPPSSHYMLAFDDSRVVAGATREDGTGFDYRLTAEGVHEVLSEALSVAPGLSSGTMEEVRIGFRPMGPDLIPLVGKIDTVDNVVIATGLGPSGLTMGPYVGSVAAALAKGETLQFDLTPYSPMRAIAITK